MQQFTAPELRDYLEQASNQPLLLDVREAWEFDICSIAGSLLIPMAKIPSKIQTLNPDQEIVVICHHGIRSANVCRYLEHQGFKHMINLSGGVQAWAQQVDNNMSVY
ncbi:MAG: rhodanese-like domain-containing protein [Gammaproteobacteria bacterium]|nr:rhodanese-like domain-containing protein [Gammaproteobacteria bacterium]